MCLIILNAKCQPMELFTTSHVSCVQKKSATNEEISSVWTNTTGGCSYSVIS